MSEARAEAPAAPPEDEASERPRLLLVSTLPPPTGGIPTWTLALLESSLAERFEMRVVDSSPSRKDEVKGGAASGWTARATRSRSSRGSPGRSCASVPTWST